MRYFLELAYNGSTFHGWQIQPNAMSVQETIEYALSKILGKTISIIGAGRTDTGVSARQMFAHFDCFEEIIDKQRFLLSLNCLCGKNIFIKNIFEVPEDSHARFDAIERTYKYFISFQRDPFLYNFFWHSPSQLDFDKMNEAAMVLTHISDFTSFAKLHSDSKTNICKVKKAIWQPMDKDPEAFQFIGDLNQGWSFTITSDRFLRNMVRSVVGTLIDVGRKKVSLSQFKEIIAKKDRCAAGTSMPAHPLFLWSIKYPDFLSLS